MGIFARAGSSRRLALLGPLGDRDERGAQDAVVDAGSPSGTPRRRCWRAGPTRTICIAWWRLRVELLARRIDFATTCARPNAALQRLQRQLDAGLAAFDRLRSASASAFSSASFTGQQVLGEPLDRELVRLGDVGLRDLAGVLGLGLGAQEGVLEARDLGLRRGKLVAGSGVSGAAASVRAAGSMSWVIGGAVRSLLTARTLGSFGRIQPRREIPRTVLGGLARPRPAAAGIERDLSANVFGSAAIASRRRTPRELRAAMPERRSTCRSAGSDGL